MQVGQGPPDLAGPLSAGPGTLVQRKGRARGLGLLTTSGASQGVVGKARAAVRRRGGPTGLVSQLSRRGGKAAGPGSGPLTCTGTSRSLSQSGFPHL